MCKKSTALALILLAAVFMSLSCSSAPAKEKLKIMLIVKAEDSTFFKTVLQGAQAAGSEYNVDIIFRGSDKEDDYETQNRLIEDAVTQNADAVVLSACDFDKTVPSAHKVMDSGIPLITIDSGINTDRDVLFIGTNNYAAGRMAAETLAELTGDEAVIGIINFEEGSGNAIERYQGFLDTIAGYPGITVADTRFSKSNLEAPRKATFEMLGKNPDITAIVAFNEWTTLGAGYAIKEAGRSDSTVMVGFDNNVNSIIMLEDGDIDTLIIQNPFAMGYLGVKYAINAINGQKIPETTETATVAINRSNMYNSENQKLLFPFAR